ncbi:MAG: Ig-like domain-containing protein, partial [Ignavibacteriales bacterium]
MAGKTILKKIVLILISALPAVFLSCANQLPPGGGPIDYTPPEIVSVYPESGTINFKDDHFEVTFSKYVDRRSAQDAIFISPPVEGTLEYDWSGKTLRVDFPSKLKDSVTYIVTFGTDLVDLNNRNRMAQAYSFSFSTGSQIDKGIISGRIYTKEPSGILLFAYPKTGAEINPVSEKPKYISQAGKNGDYKMLGLASGSYRVFAVKDEFRTFTYRIGDDLYGAPYTDVTLSERDTAFNNLDFFMTKEDTVKPRLVSATMTDRNHILIGFSEEIDSTMFNSNNFFIYDSTTSGGYKPLYAFQGRTKKTEMVLSVKTLLNEQDNVFLTVKKIGDLAGNTTLNDFVRITVTAKPDTSAPKLFQT